MTIKSDASASGGKYLSSSINSAGSATFNFDVPAAGKYVLWSRALASSPATDSFLVSVDGGPEDIYDVAEHTWSNAWQWMRVNEINPTPTPTPSPQPSPRPVTGRQFYASPQGRPNGDGSQSNPWDLLTMMNHPAAVKPGDTIYLRAGTYRLDLTPEPDTTFSSLTGTAAAPITVRAYPGERAIIDIDHKLLLHGNYTHYIGLELMCSRPNKVVQSGWSPDRPGSVGVSGRGLKVINCILHDLIDFTAFKDAIDFEMYGNVMYYFGSMGDLDRPTGTTGYIQNDVGTKLIADNLMLSSCQHLVMLYGSDDAALRGIHFEGNTLLNAGSLSGLSGFNIVAWVGERPSENISIVDNYSYTAVAEPGSNAVFWGAGGVVNKGLKITGNHFIGGAPVLRVGVWDPATITNNTLYGTNGLLWYEGGLPQHRQYDWNNNRFHYEGTQPPFTYNGSPLDFAGWQRTTALDHGSAYAPGKPTGVSVSLRPNRYEVGRAHITVYNPGLLNTVSVNIASAGLALGQRYEVRDAQNYFGTPVLTGVYDGTSIVLPMNLTTVAAIVGADYAPNFVAHPPNHNGLKLPRHTSKEFNAFVLLPR